MSRCLVFLFLIISTPASLLARPSLFFPHFAVGDHYVSVIDLANKGTASFVGSMSFVDDNAHSFPVYVDGTRTPDAFSFTLAAGEVRRFRVTAPGATASGHVLIYGQTSGTYDDQISGTLTFQYMDGSRVVDATGIGAGSAMQHFHFIGEFSTATDSYTGLALSTPFSEGRNTSLQIKAYSSNGALVDGRTIEIDSMEHRAFFIHQILAVPDGFRGTIEVIADNPVCPAVLRLEKDQLSSLDVNAFASNYDVGISLNNGRTYEAEMWLSMSDGEARGQFRFTSVPMQMGFGHAPVIGSPVGGLYIIHIVNFFISDDLVEITLSAFNLSTSADSIGGSVTWRDKDGRIYGTFSGKKRK